MLKKILIFFVFLPSYALSGTLMCEQKIAEIGNHAPGGLFIRQESSADKPGFPMLKLCSFTGQQNRTTAEDCKHIASVAAMAYAMGKIVRIHIDNTDETSCTALTNWQAVDLRYFSIK